MAEYVGGSLMKLGGTNDEVILDCKKAKKVRDRVLYGCYSSPVRLLASRLPYLQSPFCSAPNMISLYCHPSYDEV